MYREANILKDGWTNLWGGVDSGRASNLLAKNQAAFGINITLREGYPETRPPFVTPKVGFATEEIGDWWDENETQGAKYFAPTQGDPMIVAMIGGRLFRIDPLDNFRVSEITPLTQTNTTGAFISPPVDSNVTVTVSDSSKIKVGMIVTIGDGTYEVMTNNAAGTLSVKNLTATAGININSGTPVLWPDANPVNRPQAWMEQAGKWLVIQDGQSGALRYNGTETRRSAPAGEVPTGTAMVFNEEIGRLCVARVTNGIAIGNIDAGGDDDPIKFTETDYLNEGGEFRIPLRYGPITGACMLANQDRSNGQGAMLFFTEQGIHAFNLPPNREQWKNLQYPVQINMPIHGSTNHHGITNVNGDVFYRAKDGERSFALTRQEFNQWGNTPISRELGRVLNRDGRKLLRFASSCLFDNRLLFTAMPRNGRYGAYHEALCVLDFDGVSAINRVPPRFDGIWTGIKPQHLVTGNFGGEDRCFAFCRSENGGTQLWEILREGNFDGDEGRIECAIESRALDFGNPFELTQLSGFEIWCDKVVGEVDFELKHRPDLTQCWFPWNTTPKKVCQKFKDCGDDDGGCTSPITFRPGQRSRVAFGQPPDTNENQVDHRPARVGYSHELRLQWTGRARVKWALAKATRLPEDANPPVETDET